MAEPDDAARAANLVLLRGQRQRIVRFTPRVVSELPRLRIEAELVAVARIRDCLGTLHDMKPEVDRVATEDVAHAVAADDHQLETDFFGHAFEAGGAHLARRADGKAIAGNEKRFPAVHARPEVGHQIAERPGLPPLIQRLEALGNAVGGGRNLVRVDGVELLFLAWYL